MSRDPTLADLLDLGLANLVSPMVLCFALGFAAALARSDLDIPEAVGRGLALYLMLAIGFKGGVSLNQGGAGPEVVLGLLLAAALSFALPFLAFALLRSVVGLDRTNAAAVSAHYGSVSVVTFVTATQFLGGVGVPYEGHLVAMMAVMETPAIVSGLMLARAGGLGGGDAPSASLLPPHLLREILLNASIVLLVGGFLIGWATGEPGKALVQPLFYDAFNGLLCLFLLDMGLVAARQIRGVRALRPGMLAFGFGMPLLGATVGLAAAGLLGLGLGGATLLTVLCASASYIAVPAAMRLALPEANPAVYVTLSLVITFPFNVVAGIPLYFAAASALGF